MSWYIACIRKYATFAGRARRKEYWMYTLFNLIFFTVALILDNQLGTRIGSTVTSVGYGFVYLAYSLFVVLPSISVTVRRLHDTGKSGGYYFVVLIPLVGAFWLLYLMCKEGDVGANAYGEDPKAVG